MNLIYVSKACSSKMFNQLYEDSIVKPQQQDQKFHKMFLEGLATQSQSFKAYSSRPINRSNIKKVFIRRKIEQVDSIKYHYLSFINIKIFRQLSLFINLFFSLAFSLIKKRKNTIVLCDSLNMSMSLVVIILTKLFFIKSVAVVTDLPNELENKSRFYKQFTTWILKRYSSYIILSESMNPLINKRHKPSLLIEGMIYPSSNQTYKKHDIFSILYAGGLGSNSGVDVFIDAFIRLNRNDIHLVICGIGELAENITELSKKHDNIKFLGSLLNEDVIKLEHQVHLLVNPRPSTLSQTKYAFPSKLIEYMASGTPVLSTQLLGIPNEYKPYLLFFEDESVIGMKEKLEEVILNYDKNIQFGKQAKQFVHLNKTNIAQAQKVFKWFNNNSSSVV